MLSVVEAKSKCPCRQSARGLSTSAGFGAISVSFRVFPWLNSGGVGVKCK